MGILEKYEYLFDIVESAAVNNGTYIEQELANKDINAKVTGNVVKVHKDNVDKARSMVKKMGFGHKVEHGLNEEVIDEATWNDINRMTGGNEGHAYIIHGTIQGVKSGKSVNQAFADSAEDQNYYGSKFRKDREIAIGHLKKLGHKVTKDLLDESTLTEISRATVDAYLHKSAGGVKEQPTFNQTVTKAQIRIKGRDRAHGRALADNIRQIRKTLGLKEEEIVSADKKVGKDGRLYPAKRETIK